MTANATLAADSALATAAAIRSGSLTATAVTQGALERIAALDGKINAFTMVTRERALRSHGGGQAATTNGCGSGKCGISRQRVRSHLTAPSAAQAHLPARAETR